MLAPHAALSLALPVALALASTAFAGDVISVSPGIGTFGTRVTLELNENPGPMKPKAFLERVADGKRFRLQVVEFDDDSVLVQVGHQKQLRAGSHSLIVQPKGKPKREPFVAAAALELVPPTILSVSPDTASMGDIVTLAVRDLGTRKVAVKVAGRKAKKVFWPPTESGQSGVHLLDIRLPTNGLPAVADLSLYSPLGAAYLPEGLVVEDGVDGDDGSGNPFPSGIDRIALPYAQEDPEWVFYDDGRHVLGLSSEGNTILLAFAADGTLSWEREFVGSYRFARSTDGDLWFFGHAYPDYIVGKLDLANNVIRWSNAWQDYTWIVPDSLSTARAWESLPLNWNNGIVALLKPDGSLTWAAYGNSLLELSGQRWLAHGPNRMAIVSSGGKADFEGILWSQVDDLEIIHAYECADGRIAIIARLDSDALWFAKIDSTGTVSDARSYVVPEFAAGSGSIVTEDGSGGCFIANELGLSTWVLHADDQGELLWQRRVDSPFWEAVRGLVPRASGGVFVVGRRGSLQGQPWHPWIIALDAQGELEWERAVENDITVFDVLGATRATDGRLLVRVYYSDMSVWLGCFADDGALLSQALWNGVFPLEFPELPDGRRLLLGNRTTGGGSSWSYTSAFVAEIAPGGTVTYGWQLPMVPQAHPIVGVRPDGSLRVAVPTGGADSDILTATLNSGAAGACVSSAPPSGDVLTVTTGVAVSTSMSNAISGTTAQFYPWSNVFTPEPPTAGLPTTFPVGVSIAAECTP